MNHIVKRGSSGDINEGLSVSIASRSVLDFFKKKYLLKDINMNIPTGHMVLLLGGSGAGKTTFISAATVSAPGFDALASQMDVNNMSYKAVDSMMSALESSEMDLDIKGSDIINMLSDESNESVKQLRSIKVGGQMTAEEACRMLLNDDKFAELRKNA